MFEQDIRAKSKPWRFLAPLLAAFAVLIAIQACTLVQPAALTPTAPASTQESQATPTSQVQAPTSQPTQLEELPSATATPTLNQSFLPQVSNPGKATPLPTLPPPSGPQLAFLKGGDLWLVDVPGGTPQQLTKSGDLLSFVWSGDGQRLATFNGRQLCFLERDGSVHSACLELGLNDEQAKIERQMVWSPDQRTIVLWNPVNPWEEGAIGWYIVALDGSGITYRIEDPMDWGMTLTPNNEAGGYTGQALFLPDGTLVGTLTHRLMCGTSGCHFQLYEFDINAKSFKPYPNKPEEGWSEGLGLALAANGQSLANFGTFHQDCETYTTLMDVFDIHSQSRKLFDLQQEALNGLALSPDASRVVLSRNAGCTTENSLQWDKACGLSKDFDTFNLSVFDMPNNQRNDLLPGTSPAWSPDGGWIAFRSCLTQEQAGGWQPSEVGPPTLFVTDPSGSNVLRIDEGSSPTWRP